MLKCTSFFLYRARGSAVMYTLYFLFYSLGSSGAMVDGFWGAGALENGAWFIKLWCSQFLLGNPFFHVLALEVPGALLVCVQN